MPFDFDSDGTETPTIPGFDRIDRTEEAADRAKPQVAIRIDYDLCDDTGACASVCPEDVIVNKGGHSTVTAPEACTECWICVENCPSGAIEIT